MHAPSFSCSPLHLDTIYTPLDSERTHIKNAHATRGNTFVVAVVAAVVAVVAVVVVAALCTEQSCQCCRILTQFLLPAGQT